MTILITSSDEYSATSDDTPIVGRRYLLEDATTGTLAQGKAFHALLQEYWRSGCHSYSARNFMEFRDMIKRDLGAGFESFVYASTEGIVKVKTRDEIPPQYNNAKYAMGRLKSWADYTMKERRETIDRLIAEMDQAGVNTKKYREILAGLSRAA